MNCPKCQSRMETVEYEKVEIDRCTSCGGLWFDAMEQQDLRNLKGAKKIDTGDKKVGAKRDKEGKIECPRCRARMIRMVDRTQAHIWFESCPVCYGSFLDAGEFRDLTTHTIADVFRRLRKGERPLT